MTIHLVLRERDTEMKKTGLLCGLTTLAMGAGMLATPAVAFQMNSTAYPTASHPIYAEIQSKIDTKNASVGEPVKAKVITDAVLGNSVNVPRGSILTGKVTEVQSKSAGNGTVSLAIAFDEIQPKKGPPIAIHGILVGIEPKPYLENSGPSNSDLPLASTRSVSTQAGETGGSIDNSQNIVTVDAGSSVRGVQLSSPNGAGAGTLTSDHKDFKVDKGMRIAVGLESQ